MAFTKVTDNLLSSGVGTGAGNILELDSSGKLPAVDGSLLTNIPHGVDGITSSAGSSTGIRIFSGGGVVIGDTTTLTNTYESMLMVDGDNQMQGGITIGSTNSGPANGNIAALAFSPIGFSMGRRRAAIWAVSKTEGAYAGYAADLCLGAYGAVDGSSISTSHERLRILSSGGITFNGDTTSANALDDYEEGTWTPTCDSGTMSGVVGRYTKVGNKVFIDFNLANFSDKTSNQNIAFGGLPYSIDAMGMLGAGTIYQVNNHTHGVVIRQKGTTEFELYDASNPSSWTKVQYDDLGGDPNMAFAGFYETA